MSQSEDSELDAHLIRALQRDGRKSVLDLAREQNVSRHLVSERLRFLREREGLRVVAALDPSAVGHHVLTHSMARVDGPVRAAAEKIADMPDAVFVSITSGERPLVFESRHANSRELISTLDQVREISGVRELRVTTYVDVLRGFFVARDPKPIRLDELDHELIAELQRDGRASYRTLADIVRRSPSAVRTRVRRLVDSGAIRIAAVKSGGLSPARFATGLGVILRGQEERVRDFILSSQTIEFAARSHGAYDFVATAVGGSSAEVLNTVESLRELPEVSAVETWAHYDLIKEDYARSLGRALVVVSSRPEESTGTS